MDLLISENVPQHEIKPNHENTRKRRAVNNRSVQDTRSSANEVSDTENKTNAENYAKPKETLYHLLFEYKRFRAIREDYSRY